MRYLFIYLAIINLEGLIIMGIDKNRAQHHKWRISERTLFISALIGGALGVAAGMSLFHHKTKHKKFTIGIPLLVILNLAIIFLLFYYGLIH